jgi:hypothetical protein
MNNEQSTSPLPIVHCTCQVAERARAELVRGGVRTHRPTSRRSAGTLDQDAMPLLPTANQPLSLCYYPASFLLEAQNAIEVGG